MTDLLSFSLVLWKDSSLSAIGSCQVPPNLIVTGPVTSVVRWLLNAALVVTLPGIAARSVL